MCKEMPVIPVNKLVDQKRIIGKNLKAEEEERHKGSLTPPPQKKTIFPEVIYSKKCLNPRIRLRNGKTRVRIIAVYKIT
jgi:hypothetical protein